MRVTGETPRTRWIGLFFTWTVVAVLAGLHSAVFNDYVALLDRMGSRAGAITPTPMQRICPEADAQMWVRHAIDLAQGAGPQLRFTHADNAPFGREVHWDSGFAWLIVAAGSIAHAFAGVPWPAAIERALAWFNLPLLLGCVVVITTWTSRRAGLGAAVFLAAAMLGNEDFYSGFSPDFVDHHGVLSTATLGLTLGVIGMGAGFRCENRGTSRLLPTASAEARSAAIFSALCGAVGMWVSAPTLIPAIAISGIAGAGAILVWGGRHRGDDLTLDPGVWRIWGSVGAALTLAFYLLEYAPHHLGWRLEVNHPIYAAAWWGAGELLAQLAEWRIGRNVSRTIPGQRTFNLRQRFGSFGSFVPFASRFGSESGMASQTWLRLTAAIVAVSVAPVVILVGGANVFTVFDPFIARMSNYVAEGYSLSKALRLFGPDRLWYEVPWTVVAAVLGGAAWWRSRSADRIVIALAAVIALGGLAMAIIEIRWWPTAVVGQMLVIVVSTAALVGPRARWLQWVMVAVLVGGLCAPFAVARIVTRAHANRARGIDPMDALQPLYRDIAGALRASQPRGEITVLASPNASASIGYYGRFATIGTLYWENLAGIKAAAEMFSAASPDEARRVVHERGITHIVMISDENFLAEYFTLLHPDAPRDEVKRTFGYQLLASDAAPLWLEPIAYAPPKTLFVVPERVRLFRTNFAAPAAEAKYAAALTDLERGDGRDAETQLDAALAIAPESAEFWLTKAKVQLAGGRVGEAFTAVRHAIDLAATSQRFALCAQAAYGFHAAHAFRETVALCRRALDVRFEPAIANNLVWLLATNPDENVRDGAQALALAERLAPTHSEYPFLTAHAAALAECGRFDAATKIAEQAVNAAQAMGEASALNAAERQLASYRAHRPWRE